jgi:uncharacterized protein (TIGR02118 family)
MYKVVFLLKFRPELDPEDVRRAWRTTHGELALQIPGLRRYVQNHWVAAPPNCARTYDGSADCWFDDQASCERALSSPEWQVLIEDDVKLFDRDRTPTFEGGVAIEHVMRWDCAADDPRLPT